MTEDVKEFDAWVKAAFEKPHDYDVQSYLSHLKRFHRLTYNVLRDRYVDGLIYKSIASKRRVSTIAVHMRIVRARRQLKELMQRE